MLQHAHFKAIFTLSIKGYTNGMKFVHGSPQEAATDIAKRLNELLASGRSVLWLVSGGSNMPVQTMAMNMIPDKLSKHLYIIPVDERFGPYNHKDSNTGAMRKAGFDPKHAQWIDLLEQNFSLAQTTQLFNDFLAREIAKEDYIFVTLGMAEDGHTAGILPQSPALTSTDFAVGYKAPDYTRITVCADTLAAHADEVVLCAFGQNKLSTLERLRNKDESRQILPAMILHQIENCTVYHD